MCMRDGTGEQSSGGWGVVAEVGGVTSSKVVVRCQDMGKGRRWHCWGQVRSNGVLQVGGN